MDVSCFGVHKGGRCPPRTASLQRAKRLTTQSAGVPGLHVSSSLAVPSRALPFMLVCHFVYACGIHEPVSIPGLPAHPVSPSSAPASPQQCHYRGQVSKPMRWGLKARAKENKDKKNEIDSLSKVHPPCAARVQGPIGSFLHPRFPCSHPAGVRIPGSCDHPRPRIVREEVAGLVRGP